MGDWSKAVVSVILANVNGQSEEFAQLVQPAPESVQGDPTARKYVVNSTSFGYAVVVITNIDAGSTGQGREDDYRMPYQIKTVWE